MIYEKYLAHVAELAPLERALLLIHLQKGHYVYTQLIQLRMTLLGWSEDNFLSIRSDTISRGGEREVYDINEGETEDEWRARMGTEEIEQVVQLLKDLDLWKNVEENDNVSRKNLANWDERNPAGKAGATKGEFELVQVGFVFVSLSSQILSLTHRATVDCRIYSKRQPSSFFLLPLLP